jgi:RNA polymerase sigma factor (TIGR02999 family)
MSELVPARAATEMESSDAGERDRLFALLYDELHKMAQRTLRRGGAMMLTTTSLLHETYLSVAQRHGVDFHDHNRFMAYASRAMRGLIVDYIRRRQAQKRGGEFEITALPTEPAISMAGEATTQLQIEKLNEALEILTRIDARLAECVDLKFFCGLSFADIARLREVSERTVQRDWDKARTLLRHLMNEAHPGSDLELFGP